MKPLVWTRGLFVHRRLHVDSYAFHRKAITPECHVCLHRKERLRIEDRMPEAEDRTYATAHKRVTASAC